MTERKQGTAVEPRADGRKDFPIRPPTLVAAIVVAVAACLVVWFGLRTSHTRRWFALQERQVETIRRLGEFPPPGWRKDHWQNEIITPNNVWGNVIYSPNSATMEEMRLLQWRLDRILAETTSENSFESVDRVFALLIERNQTRTDFVAPYREEFRQMAAP